MADQRRSAGHGLTQEQAEQIMAYVWFIRDRLNLHVWRIGLANEAAEADANAAIWIADDKHVATLYLASDFLTRPPEDQRRTLVHELLHLVMRNVQEAVTVDLRSAGRLPGSVFRPFVDRFRRSTEIAVEDLARIISNTLPPVPWVQPAESETR